MSSIRGAVVVAAGVVSSLLLAGCGSGGTPSVAVAGSGPAGLGGVVGSAVASTPGPSASTSRPSASSTKPTASPSARKRVPPLPRAGNPGGGAAVPSAAQAVDTTHPTRTVGHGTPGSCTSAAVVAAVAAGGVITFSCGPDPVVITMAATAKVRNTSSRVVLDGGGKVTLSGAGRRRILYLDTCDQAQGWTTSHCNDQSSPQLTVQNLTFADGNSTGDTAEGGGGGAILDRGGRLKVVNSRFVRNRCDRTGPDLGGAAIRALDQSGGLPVYIVDSTFGGAPGQGGSCSNGGALSSIGVSWTVLNSVLTYNSAVGSGANPARSGTPGGGSGGAIYTDGNRYTVTVAGSVIEHNSAKEGGGALFYVSNDRTGSLTLQNSTLKSNPSAGFETAGYPGIFFLGAGRPSVQHSTLG